MKAVTILGGSAVRDYRPDGTDVWGCNFLHKHLDPSVQIHSWFQMHTPLDIATLENPEHIAWLYERHPFPIYVQNSLPEMPSSVTYPMWGVVREWKFGFPVSFGCTFAYQVALAMTQDYEAIVLRGINLLSPREGWMEAPNLMAWLGLAAGKGIEVHMDGRLAQPLMYGFEARGVPLWAGQELMLDIIADNVPETRIWRDVHFENVRSVKTTEDYFTVRTTK